MATRSSFDPAEPGEAAPPAGSSWLGGGVAGNARLTALGGMLLLALLFVEGLTLLQLRAMISVHVFVGVLLIPPVLLKLVSTGYRFIRYYTGNTRYRAAGPPSPILRMIAPVLVASTVAVIATGIILLPVGPSGSHTWLQLHKLSFILWFAVMTIHVLAYLPRAATLALADVSITPEQSSHSPVAGALTRGSFVLGSLILGVVVALMLLPSDTAWVHWLSTSRHGG